jgi:hypothetical protein
MPSWTDELSWMADPSSWGMEGPDARWVVLVVGMVLVLFGSRFYKLLLITPGFVGGVLGAIHYSPTGDSVTRAVVALVAGIAGAATLVYVERLALAAVGAAVFGGLAIALAPLVLPQVEWPVLAAAAVVGAFVVPFVYRRSLRLITPVLGAIAVAWAVSRPDDPWLILGLSALGGVLQFTLTGKKAD